MIYDGPPLPQLPDAERAKLRAELEAVPWVPIDAAKKRSARWWRWQRYVVRAGGKGLRGYAREAFILDHGLVHQFDYEEVKRVLVR